MMTSRVNGLDIHVVPDTPRYQLPSDLPLPSAFREEINAWALKFFGVENRIADEEVWTSGNTLFVNPRTYQMMRQLNIHSPGKERTHDKQNHSF